MCSEEKYEVSHGFSSLLGFGEMRCVACLWGMVPRGSSYFSEEYTVCHAGTPQPENAKFATTQYKPKAAAQKCSGPNKTKLAFDSSCKSIHVESLHDDEKY